MARLASKAAVLTLTALVMGMGSPANAGPWPQNVHTVRHDSGGYVIDYAIKMRRMERSGQPIRFSGRCDSACTLYLALPKSQACVSKGAAFGFHLPSGSSSRGDRIAANFMLNIYPAWVRKWLDANGGLTTQLKVMRYDYARQHLPECGQGKTVRQDRMGSSHLVALSAD